MNSPTGEGRISGVTAPSARQVSVALGAVALVLWAFTDWFWLVPLLLLAAALVVRLLVWLFFEPWRNWAGPAALAPVIVYMLDGASVRAILVALGVFALLVAWFLRAVSPIWLRWIPLALGLAGVLGGGIAQFIVAENDRVRYEQAQQLEGDLLRARLRPDSGIGMVWALSRAVLEDDPTGCWHFTPTAAAEFARVHGAPDCAAAIHLLHGQVTDPEAYAEAEAPRSDITTYSGTSIVRVTGCNLYSGMGHSSPGGPQLGQLQLERDRQFPTEGGYIITRYTRCDSRPPSAAPTTTATPSGVLPTYPPAFAGTLAKAAVGRNTTVCELFTEQGKREFAAANNVTDCQAAVHAIADRIVDPKTYDNDPQGANQGSANGKTILDACHLTWHRLGGTPNDPPPGPQLGVLTLINGPNSQGYLIDGYQPC